jgi:K+-sensing histidine kinase KdpD
MRAVQNQLSNFAASLWIHAILVSAVMIQRFNKPIKVAMGTLLSAVFAALLTFLFHKSAIRGVLPLAFIIVLVLLSRQFGFAVSLAGSLSAAIVFSLFLFPPVGSAHVESDAARMNIAWMILGAVAVSYLLYPGNPMDNSRRH